MLLNFDINTSGRSAVVILLDKTKIQIKMGEPREEDSFVMISPRLGDSILTSNMLDAQPNNTA